MGPATSEEGPDSVQQAQASAGFCTLAVSSALPAGAACSAWLSVHIRSAVHAAMHVFIHQLRHVLLPCILLARARHQLSPNLT